MWSKERHKRILALLESSRLVSANDLPKLLGVSRETVRRDLLELEEAGLIDRVHGGAVLRSGKTEAPFEKRRDAQAVAKQNIARKAVSLVEPGMSLLVDAGTTTAAFGHALSKLSNFTLITNSVEITQVLKAAEADIEVFLLGGQIVSDVPATFGELTLSEIRRFKVDLAIVSPVALSASEGAFSYALKEAEVAKAMLDQAARRVFLCDRTKLGETSRVQICEAGEVDLLVTDSKALPEQTSPFENNGIPVLI